jgi:hypothetical protein
VRNSGLEAKEVDRVRSRLLSITLAIMLGVSLGPAGCAGEVTPVRSSGASAGSAR